MKPRNPITIGIGPVSQKMGSDPRSILAKSLMSDSDTSNSQYSGLNNAISKMLGAYTQKKVSEDYAQRDQGYNDTMQRALGTLLGGPAEQDVNNPNITWDAREPNPALARTLLGTNPDTADMAQQLALQEYQNNQEMQNQEAKYAREDSNWQRDAELKRELARMKSGGGQMIVDPDTGEITQNYSDKPLPVGALKLQQEALDALAAAKSISETSNLLSQQLKTGGLDVGPIDNLESKARNWAGASTPNSQAFANMETGLEKIRNDSLRLNKGVQTEGDAVRAMNEVIASKNDPVLLQQAMDKLSAINERGAELQRLQINNIRGNYNAAPMDFEQVNALPSPVPGGDKIRQYLSSKGMSPEKIDAYLKSKGM